MYSNYAFLALKYSCRCLLKRSKVTALLKLKLRFTILAGTTELKNSWLQDRLKTRIWGQQQDSWITTSWSFSRPLRDCVPGRAQIKPLPDDRFEPLRQSLRQPHEHRAQLFLKTVWSAITRIFSWECESSVCHNIGARELWFLPNGTMTKKLLLMKRTKLIRTEKHSETMRKWVKQKIIQSWQNIKFSAVIHFVNKLRSYSFICVFQ